MITANELFPIRALIYFVCAVIAFCQAPKTGPTMGASVVDPITGFEITVPHGWLLDRTTSVFTLTTFPPHRRPKAILVPLDEAELAIVVAPKGTTDLDSWIKSERRAYPAETLVEWKPIDGMRLQVKRSYQVTIDYNDLIPRGIIEVRYFELQNGYLFKSVLIYRGSRRVSEFHAVLNSVLRSLRIP